MIKGLTGGSGIYVQYGINNLPYVAPNNSNPMQGMIRVWGNDLQVFDGDCWIAVKSSYSTVELTPEIVDILEWAKKKKIEESKMQQLSETHPAVKIAVENLKKAQEHLEVTTILSKDQ
jgi:hypothetical protein